MLPVSHLPEECIATEERGLLTILPEQVLPSLLHPSTNEGSVVALGKHEVCLKGKGKKITDDKNSGEFFGKDVSIYTRKNLTNTFLSSICKTSLCCSIMSKDWICSTFDIGKSCF